MPKLSTSGGQDLPLAKKIVEWWQLAKLKLDKNAQARSFEYICTTADEYGNLLRTYAGAEIDSSTILEIGFGARPYRMLLMLSKGLNIYGVDIEQPVLSGHLSEFNQILKTNGFERLCKSLVRWLIFDRPERKRFYSLLNEQGLKETINESRFWVADTSTSEFSNTIWGNKFDLIVSEDVFEHIELSKIETLTANMASWLNPSGLALIRPNVFTGIAGGHLVEWYPDTIDRPRARVSEPWEHLRKKRFTANTYLNKLSRADYRRLFQEHFVILDEKVKYPDLGKQFLTQEIRADLANYPDEELFSNNVLFVLSPKKYASTK